MALWTMHLLRTARGPTPTCDLANVNAFAPWCVTDWWIKARYQRLVSIL